MKRVLLILSFIIYHLSFIYAQSEVQLMKGWPCGLEKGYEQGVSACYGGVIKGYLIMAGGANFAETPAADGGKKCFYKGIYAAKLADSDSLLWKKTGELPEPMAYGISLLSQSRIIIIGGSNDKGSLNRVYSISIKGGKADLTKLPSLPIPLDNLAGAIYKNKVYVGGGMSQGVENLRVFCLDLSRKNAQWQETTYFSGTPSVQSAACMKDGKPFFFGGYRPKTADHDAKVYDGPSGGAFVQLPSGEVYVSGGVNHDIFLDAISGEYSLIDKKDYLLQSVSWYQFNSKLQKYNVSDNTYKFVLESSDIARAGAQMVAYGKTLFIIGGEIKPGIRINNIIKIKL